MTAELKPVPDVAAPGLRVLFCGINPGLLSAQVGHHFAHPANRFWRVLHLSGFTERVLRPHEQAALLEAGLGITNLVSRPTAKASELTTAELREGRHHLEELVAEVRPRVVAHLGMGSYRSAYARPKAAIGRQQETMCSGETLVWLLPNPSGLQARYQLDELVSLFAQLQEAALTSPADGLGTDGGQ